MTTLQTKNRYVIEVIDSHSDGEVVRFMVGPVNRSSGVAEHAERIKRVAAFDGTRTCTVHELYEGAS